MSLPTTCCTSTCTPEPVLVPGVEGAAGTNGTDGADGVNAFTLLTADVTLPAIGNSVSVSVADNSWASVGQVVFASDGTDWGTFEVLTKTGTTAMLLNFLGVAGDAAPGAVIGTGGQVSPGGHPSALSAALPQAFTDNSTGTPSDTIAAGVGCHTITIPLTSLATGLSTSAIDLLTNYVLGYAFKVLKFDFVTTVAGTGAGASQVFNLEIGTTNVTNNLTVTLASTAAIGQISTGAPDPIIANNVGTATDTLSIEMAAGGTVFTAGAGYFVIKVQNMDEADAAASLADHVNNLILALT